MEDSWEYIVAGKSGIAPITAFDASGFSSRISGSVKNFDASLYIANKDLKKMDIDYLLNSALTIYYGLYNHLKKKSILINYMNILKESMEHCVCII